MSNASYLKVKILSHFDPKRFRRACVGCLILSHDGKIVLQQRDEDCPTFPGRLATFGGGVEPGELPMQALIRELKEELGADVIMSDVVDLGVLAEEETDYNELVYVYFWKDKRKTITGCYEGTARYYHHAAEVEANPNAMSDVLWLLQECKKRNLI